MTEAVQPWGIGIEVTLTRITTIPEFQLFDLGLIMTVEKWMSPVLRYRIRNLTPSYIPHLQTNDRWFLMTMGTGIVAVLIHQLPYQFRGLYEISLVFLFTNIILFITLFVLSILRYAVWPEIWGLMLRDPVQSLYLYLPISKRWLILEARCQWDYLRLSPC
jgi:hypothetical protein